MSVVATIGDLGTRAAVPSIALRDQAERRALVARAWALELGFLVLVALGLALVWSASSPMAQAKHQSSTHFLAKQLAWAALAIVGFFVASRTPLKVIERLSVVALPAVLLALGYLLLPGTAGAHGGAVRWIPLGPISLQPAEPAKVALVLALARWLSKLPVPDGRITLTVLGVAAIPALLVYLQPDLGTAVVLMSATFVLLYLAGARLTHLMAIVMAILPALAWAMVHHEYRWRRLIAFWEPWENARSLGYQIVQSFVAFGSGGLFGRGLGGGTQKLFYLPESHTDFVFAVLGEEMGFLGVASVAVLFFLLIVQGTRVALAARDRFGYLLASGLTCLIGLQAAANMAVTLGLVPTKGLALPFLSYGGSALLSSSVALGFVLAVDRHSASLTPGREERA